MSYPQKKEDKKKSFLSSFKFNSPTAYRLAILITAIHIARAASAIITGSS